MPLPFANFKVQKESLLHFLRSLMLNSIQSIQNHTTCILNTSYQWAQNAEMFNGKSTKANNCESPFKSSCACLLVTAN